MTDYFSFFNYTSSFNDSANSYLVRLVSSDWFNIGFTKPDFGSKDVNYFLELFDSLGFIPNNVVWVNSQDLKCLGTLSTSLAIGLADLSLPKNDPSNILNFFPSHKTEETLFDLEL